MAQTKGSEVERAEQQLGARQRQVYHGRKAEAAAGVGEPDGEDHEATERDADGRHPWEEPPETKKMPAHRHAAEQRPVAAERKPAGFERVKDLLSHALLAKMRVTSWNVRFATAVPDCAHLRCNYRQRSSRAEGNLSVWT